MKKDAKYFNCKSLPVIGQEIYVRGAMYMSRGEDDFAGGKAVISKIEECGGSQPYLMVGIAERPGWLGGWATIEAEQEALAARYGDERAHPDPDTRPEFNCWVSPGDTVHTTRIDEKTGKAIHTSRIATKYEK